MTANSIDAFLESVPLLFAAAQRGDLHGAMVSVRRLLEQLRSVDPRVADALKARLPMAAPASATRRAAAEDGTRSRAGS